MPWARKRSSADEATPAAPAPSWDSRGWVLGIGASLLLLGVASEATDRSIEAALDARFPVYLWGDDAGMLVSDAATWCQMLLLPAILTVIARRRPFLWGALPILIEMGSNAVWGIVTHDKSWLWDFFAPDQLLNDAGMWVVASGVGLGVRGLMRRRARARAARAAATAEREAASAASVWPPAPR